MNIESDREQHQLRADGRRFDQLRPFVSEQSLLSRADGSARLSAGDTTVIVAVHGPKQCTNPRMEHPERAAVEVVVKPPTEANRGGGPLEKTLEELLGRITYNVVKLEMFPRSAITVVAQIMHDAGSLESTLVNCLCLALLDAAIPMTATFAASSASISKQGMLLLDPLEEESQEAAGGAFVCCTTNDKDNIIASKFTGHVASQELMKLLEGCKKATQTVKSYLQLAIERRGKRDARPQSQGTEVVTLRQKSKDS